MSQKEDFRKDIVDITVALLAIHKALIPLMNSVPKDKIEDYTLSMDTMMEKIRSLIERLEFRANQSDD